MLGNNDTFELLPVAKDTPRREHVHGNNTQDSATVSKVFCKKWSYFRCKIWQAAEDQERAIGVYKQHLQHSLGTGINACGLALLQKLDCVAIKGKHKLKQTLQTADCKKLYLVAQHTGRSKELV